MDDGILLAGLSLAEQNFAAHWLRRRSKAPIAKGWSTAPVADIATLRQSYRRGYNLRVRCGHYSTPAPGCGLVITDTDIKVPTYALKLLTHSPICWDPSTPQRSLRGAATVAGMIGGRVRWIDCPQSCGCGAQS